MTAEGTPQPPELMTDAQFEDLIRLHVLRGYRIVYRSPDMVTVEWQPRVNNALHAVLTLVTLGLWLPVWLLRLFAHRRQQITLTKALPQPGRPIEIERYPNQLFRRG
jgi:hypothetical protein